jgi:hypothetical protein
MAGSDAEATRGVGALTSFDAVEKGFENGLALKDSLNLVESVEHPESQTPTRPVRAARAAYRLASNAAKFLIGLTHSNAT